PSTGTPRKMRRVGTLDFTMHGQPLKLLAYLEVGERTRLFVAFNDRTSGTETYAGGRFMDLDRNATGIYEVDFNRAYFPYCYYNPTFECPLPPKENRLTIPVRAGERLRKSEVGSLKSDGVRPDSGPTAISDFRLQTSNFRLLSCLLKPSYSTSTA